MLKKLLSIFLGLTLSSIWLTGCTNTSIKDTAKTEKATIIFRLAENQPEDYPTTLGDKEFARLVNQRTQGRIKIEVYSGGQLGSEVSITDQIQFGAVDFARLSITTLTEHEKSMSVLMLPYIYRDREHMFKVLEGDIGEKVLTKLEKSTGIMGLAWLDAGTRSFYNSKKEIKSPEDMKGLKIRTPETGLVIELVKAIGAIPIAMAYGDVYSALKTGVIDGAENNWPSFESSKHYEVAKFFTVDEHIRIPELIVASSRVMEKLSTEDRKIVSEAAAEAALLERKEWIKREESSRKKMEDYGVKVTVLQSNNEFSQQALKLYDKYAGEYKDLINEIINTK
ncbi:TRAP transporter substrate-binding protein [Clostridium swellfunianum]|uniref:TRAP transporter substrate-binding protein n=1 Tax=Clostridium swellfunianum TaxID=1367462 RepID=UPI00202F7AF6|nr:TRAP transporter substrate-binding protein [Clostridium swellfunianum]MCM0648193.1 TRAP transporter substrate-binding protein [Clostridium swellfunianum]